MASRCAVHESKAQGVYEVPALYKLRYLRSMLIIFPCAFSVGRRAGPAASGNVRGFDLYTAVSQAICAHEAPVLMGTNGVHKMKEKRGYSLSLPVSQDPWFRVQPYTKRLPAVHARVCCCTRSHIIVLCIQRKYPTCSALCIL